LGLGYLKAILNQKISGLKVKILDFHQGWGRQTVRIPPELNYLKAYYQHDDRGPFCGFHGYYRFGAGPDEIRIAIAKENPDVVAISSLFSPYYREALEVAKIAKSISSEIRVVLGGSHVSSCPDSILTSKYVDYVIVGEGERALAELVEHFRGERAVSEVSSLGYKHLDKLIYNEKKENFDLNLLPFPEFSDLPMSHYLFEGRPLTFLVTSRSCPHRCSFCSVHNTFGFKYRRRKIDNVLCEIKLRYEQGYRVIDFEDDNLTFYVKEMKLLCQGLIEMFPNNEMEFLAMNGVSYLSLDSELLNLMWSAGFKRLNLALVSSDKSVLETTKRPHTVEKYVDIVNEAKKLGFKITSYQILGLPFETLTSMIQTLSFNTQQPVLLGASMFYMTPNSPVAKSLDYPVTATNMFTSRLTAMAIENENFCRDDIYTLFVTTRIINFVKGLTFDLSNRDQRGLHILRHLLNKKELLADTNKGFVVQKRFNVDLFLKVWSTFKSIMSINGRMVDLKNFTDPEVPHHESQNYQGEIFSS